MIALLRKFYRFADVRRCLDYLRCEARATCGTAWQINALACNGGPRQRIGMSNHRQR